MNHLAAPSRLSWLALVAETAGVSGTAIARVQLSSRGISGPVRAVVQVRNTHEQVVGATFWYGYGHDLRLSSSVDVGYNMESSDPLTVVAWLESQPSAVPARQRGVPMHATRLRYDPTVALKLMLKHAPVSEGRTNPTVHIATAQTTSDSVFVAA